MPSTKNFAQRIEVLDEILSGIKKYLFDDLLDLLNFRLENNGFKKVSRETLFGDLRFLREKGAPINEYSKSNPYYYYTEKFSLKNIPIDDDDIAIMKKAVAILKKATDIKLNAELDDIISKLENKIHTNVADERTIIAFEEHTHATGREYFDDIFTAIHEKCPLKIVYQPFGKEEREWIIHPYMLKEYRNRWFLFGRESTSNKLHNLGLDRIKGKLRNSSEPFIDNDLFNPDTYFANLIGVTFHEEQKEPQDVIIKVKKNVVDYIKTKPIHKSQSIVQEYKNGDIEICICLFDNYELRSLILSHGPDIEVIRPISLRDKIKSLYTEGLEIYK